MPKIVTIIVTYNSSHWIKQCLDSLQHSVVPTDVIIVDNTSGDETLNLVQQHPLPVDVIALDSNVGFGKANNIALRKAYHANYTHFFLLNHDAWLTNQNDLKSLFQTLDNNEAYGIVSAIHLERNLKKMDRHFEHYLSDHSAINTQFFSSAQPFLHEVNFVNAAGWLISRPCLEKVGLFHPLFEHYGEDINFVQRVQHAGFKVGIVDNVYMVHDRNYDNRKAAVTDGKRAFERRMLLFLLDPKKKVGLLSRLSKTVVLFTKLIDAYGFFKSLTYLGWSFKKTAELKRKVTSFDSNELFLTSLSSL